MRLKKALSVLFLITIISYSCQEDNSLEEINTELNEESKIPNLITPFQPKGAEKVANKLVVAYKSSVTEPGKTNLRDFYKVSDYQSCNCNNSNIELWTFNLDSLIDPGGVEEIKTKVNTDPELESADFQYSITLPSFIPSSFTTPDFVSKIKTANTGINIAVIDTGLDPSFPDVPRRYLYNSALVVDCNDANLSGWDFVEGDSVPQDQNGHGSKVTALIAEKLYGQNVDFQILPIKAFDQSGKGSLFNIACALQYVFELPDIDVINLSFGWYGANSPLIENLITNNGAGKVIVTSAGNSSVNTDLLAHYPSGYDASNIISVGALNASLNTMASFSNFGNATVDLTAPGIFHLKDYEPSLVGTSYSCAFISAKAAEFLDNPSDPQGNMIQSLILQDGVFVPGIFQRVKNPYVIMP